MFDLLKYSNGFLVVDVMSGFFKSKLFEVPPSSGKNGWSLAQIGKTSRDLEITVDPCNIKWIK